MLTVQDIGELVPNILEGLNDLAGIIAAIIGGICALKGIGYLETLKKKKAAATFSFWSQLSVRLCELKAALYYDKRILNGLYSEDIRETWVDTTGASPTVVNKFYQNAHETLFFIKSTPDQMPAYKNWMEDYKGLISFLVDVIQYDVRDLGSGFKFTNDSEEEFIYPVDYCNSICTIIDNLLNGMKSEQDEAAERVCSEI